MGDYSNIGLPHHTSTETKEKYCKYSYSYCAICDKQSPRRRSKSETNECCKRKCREMKSLTPKKYDKCIEYENMEMEFDSKGWHETKYDCCRIRSNLVELPTSYIANNDNCQIPSNLSVLQDDINCLKAFKQNDFCPTSNSFDLRAPFEHVRAIDPRTKLLENVKNVGKIETTSLEPAMLSYIKSNGYHAPKSRIIDGLEFDNSNYSMGSRSNTSNCREYCQLVDFKSQDADSQTPLCYNTETYFNRQIDRENYSKEVDYLREKLKFLHNSSYTLRSNQDVNVQNVDSAKGNILRESCITTITEAKHKVEEKQLPSEGAKYSNCKISLKTRKINVGKTQRGKARLENIIIINSSISESESDSVEDDVAEEDSQSISSSDPISTDESSKDSSSSRVSVNVDSSPLECTSWPVRSSLFPNIPPYVKFRPHDLETVYKLPNGKKYFKWKLSTITPIIVRKTLSNSGFALVRKSNQWLGTWGKHMKSPMFKTLKDTQKLNHFPGTFQLGRKDRLWRNFQKMISKYGLKEFGFLPHTYVLPQELKILKQTWDFKINGGKEMWIIKPPASARGVGIKVINKWSQLPKKTSLVCQKYIHNPYLINGSKFDLRLYVLVTSFHPLRIYLYPEGLARFASAKYSDDVKDLKDRYMHLTNYSINKLSSQYTANEDANSCQGHKWTLTKLMEYLHIEGVDTKVLWKNLQQLVIKTIISSEALITPLCEENMNSYYNCYELFGVDVLLDEHLKPWLLEVNISPSLHSSSPLDAYVKGPLVKTLFDLAQFHFPLRLSQNVRNAPQCFDNRLYTTALTKKERGKHSHFELFESREDYLDDILYNLTGDDIRHLLRAEDEYVVKGRFERIFPTAHTYKYMEFMEARYYNRLFDAWEAKYSSKREDGIALLQSLCAKKLHLKVAHHNTVNKSCQNMTPGETMISNPQPSYEGHTRPLEEIMQKASISTKLLLCEEIKV
ncbi:tubulin polyglutamylase ttll-4-like isoform X2 [Euwallacea similis]|uniref:tubulin polyglutamylase ttll-4-like isoform X2 n=1 Tax=Euwallacea similis TaxID=1736056 RepID=UPI00344C1B06